MDSGSLSTFVLCKPCKRYAIFFATVIVILSLLGLTFVKWGSTTPVDYFTQQKRVTVTPGKDLLDVDFYVHPNDFSVAGIKFHMEEEARKLAKELIQEVEDSFNKNPVNFTSVDTLPKIALATGVSSNHFEELLAHIDRVPLVFPNRTLIVYDLGLKEEEIKKLRNVSFVNYRKFDFSRYPKHVEDLHNYAWKPLLFQQILSEYGGVMWMDSSIILTRNITHLLQRMVKLQTGFLFYLPGAEHSIASATHPQMLQYLPMANLEVMTDEMNQGGGVIILNTPEVLRNIFRWVLLCVLHRECISPTGAKLYCGFKFPQAEFGGCHRFDQAMFSIIVANANNYTKERYRLNKDEYPCEIQKM